MSEFLQKIFGNQEVEDQPFPEIPPHTHDGQNSPLLGPSSIDSVQIKSGAVGTVALADDSVNSEKIIDSAVLTQHLNALAVTEQKLASAAVATDKIKNGAVNASKLIQTEAVITVSAQIAEATILSAHIGIGVIQNAHLANAIVTNAKIVDATIQSAKIGDAQITTAKIEDLAVQWAKIDNLAVGNSKIMNLAISTAKIQDAAVGSVQIADAAITNAKIANLSVTNAKIDSVSADKITAGQINLTSAGYLSTPYGGIRIGYLRTIGGTAMYGIQAGPGHGLMLDDGANGYARMWVDTSGNRPLCIDTTANDRIFFKASSGNDIMRLYGNNAWSGGHIDIMTSLRIGTSQPSGPVSGQMYYEPNPSGTGTGGRLMIYNGYSWHAVAWYDDI